MSKLEDFYRIDCDKIDANKVNAYLEMKLNDENTALCYESSWGSDCVDLTPAIKTNETLTTLYLSPEQNPNCLVYEPERGDNICIHGDDLSRIISLQYLKDVQQTAPTDGIVYMFDETTNLFVPYDLKTTINNINTAIQNINAAITNLTNRMTSVENRVTVIEEKLTPPDGTPNDARVAFTNINILSDYGAVVNDQGVATTLNKNHGVYGHSLAEDWPYDNLMG